MKGPGHGKHLRKPLPRIALIIVVVLLGLGSRRFGSRLPEFLASYSGDTLWALMAFLGIGLLLPAVSTRSVAWLALGFSVMIEVSQLYQSPWINSIRATTLGALVLGRGFLWSDLVCYAAGVGLGVLIERGPSWVRRTISRDPS